jgi:tetratricopeptide (TPR) repeat protein
MKRTFAVAIAVVCALTAPARADETADAHLQDGLARYEAGDFAGAMDAFDAGYAVEPRPAFLFAAAQAARRSGDCRRAIDYYDRFLASDPSESQAEAARAQRERCAEMLPAEAEPEPATAKGRPWYADPITDGAVVGSTILLLAGGAFALSANGAADDANAALTYDEHDAAAGRASQQRLWSAVALGGGAVLGAVAVWRIIRHPDVRNPDRRHPDGRDERAAWRVGAGPGLGLAVGGDF